jgi:hypothetical protein
MTRWLYIWGMTEKPISEANPTAERDSKSRTGLTATAWLFVTTVTYLVTLYLRQEYSEWAPALRVGLALLPLLPGVLYLRQLWGSFQLLDELQRRIQLEAWGFAMAGTVVVTTSVNVLNAHGLGFAHYPHGLEIGGVYITMFFLWSIGTSLANARYR